ncbi:hypothetical protein HG15A2_10930 [Adhaeretor mobilis]|uniref:Uncharacterized protein n=1 Tax=Adhaeretor mobilis TaxID=1930276 RepID=A0A517MSH1_9BACT|nr:hypothetical protein HG15A2_10930 [Adhaeretor mobilis]
MGQRVVASHGLHSAPPGHNQKLPRAEVRKSWNPFLQEGTEETENA